MVFQVVASGLLAGCCGSLSGCQVVTVLFHMVARLLQGGQCGFIGKSTYTNTGQKDFSSPLFGAISPLSFLSTFLVIEVFQQWYACSTCKNAYRCLNISFIALGCIISHSFACMAGTLIKVSQHLDTPARPSVLAPDTGMDMRLHSRTHCLVPLAPPARQCWVNYGN